MGTVVLPPQDCLIERIGVSPAVFQHHGRRNFNGNGSAKPRVTNRKPVVRTDQRKRLEKNGRSEPRRSASLDDLRSRQNHNHNTGHLMMGQVTILRRGESLDLKISGRHQPAKMATDDLVVCGTARLGPDPEQIRIRDLKSVLLSTVAAAGTNHRSDMYAGSAISMSPSPRSLPLPSFFSKKPVSKVADDPATRDLRRLLRLD